jgi:hypothetical protein
MTGMIPVRQCDWRRERVMMGRRSRGQRHLFYQFHLDEAVPEDHLVRKVDALCCAVRSGWRPLTIRLSVGLSWANPPRSMSSRHQRQETGQFLRGRLASAPHQRPEPRWADLATREARTSAKLAPVRPQASDDECYCQDGDDEHQQNENLPRIHGDLAFHAGDKLTA